MFPTVDYRAGKVRIIDQTLLPAEERVLELADYREVADAIRKLKVRGAPAIGIAAAYGVLVALENILRSSSPGFRGYFFDREKGVSAPPGIDAPAREIRDELHRVREVLASTRPTAVNLFWALERIGAVIDGEGNDAVELSRRIAEEIFAIHREELEVEYTIGKNGSVFIEDGMGILTHCNAGGLATAGYGTALGVLYRAYEDGKRFTVYADETRPLLQGARITTWELQKRGIKTVLLCDNAAASLFAAGKIDAAIVGADRIAANGDTANKVGTLGVALLCERFGKPFYVAAPWSSFDTNLASGVEIPIEERDGCEVTTFWGRETAPRGTFVYNPAFDVTPAEFITAVITERGVIESPDADAIRRLARESG